jgi:hypothetical protein
MFLQAGCRDSIARAVNLDKPLEILPQLPDALVEVADDESFKGCDIL